MAHLAQSCPVVIGERPKRDRQDHVEPDGNRPPEPPQIGAQHHRQNVAHNHRPKVYPGQDREVRRNSSPQVRREQTPAARDIQRYHDHDSQERQLRRQQKSVRHEPGIPMLSGRKPSRGSQHDQDLPKNSQGKHARADCQYQKTVGHLYLADNSTPARDRVPP